MLNMVMLYLRYQTCTPIPVEINSATNSSIQPVLLVPLWDPITMTSEDITIIT